MTSTPVRLQKYLADRGIGSRRACETLIADGRVRVDGEVVTELGTKVDPSAARVLVDGDPVATTEEGRRNILLYKPRGYICSASSKQGKTVYALLGPIEERLVPAGRLDKNSEGLLILSNNGDLVNRLTHPRHGHEKAYEVTVQGSVSKIVLEALRRSFVLDGYQTIPAMVKKRPRQERGGTTVLEFVLKEGRNRQIRRMCSQLGLRITRLVRARIGPITDEGLVPGRWRELSAREVTALSGQPSRRGMPRLHATSSGS